MSQPHRVHLIADGKSNHGRGNVDCRIIEAARRISLQVPPSTGASRFLVAEAHPSHGARPNSESGIGATCESVSGRADYSESWCLQEVPGDFTSPVPVFSTLPAGSLVLLKYRDTEDLGDEVKLLHHELVLAPAVPKQ